MRVCVSGLGCTYRCHIVEQFNSGMYDIIIASDKADLDATSNKDGQKSKPKKGKSKSRRADTEYGVARGIDFQFVSNVVNFDFPPSPEAYIHRVGRYDCNGTLISSCNLHQSDTYSAVCV